MNSFCLVMPESTFTLFTHPAWRLNSNIKSKSSNITYLNIIKIFNKLFKKMKIIKKQNLVVTSTVKKGVLKFMGKITSVTGKSIFI